MATLATLATSAPVRVRSPNTSWFVAGTRASSATKAASRTFTPAGGLSEVCEKESFDKASAASAPPTCSSAAAKLGMYTWRALQLPPTLPRS